MKAWQNIGVVGFFGALIVAGCTVTVGDGGDAGAFQTGGTSSTSTGGAANSSGGSSSTTTASTSSTGGASTVYTTVVECKAKFDANGTAACGDPDTDTTGCNSCLQTYNCTTAYKSCSLDSACTSMLNAMMDCMAKVYDGQITGVAIDQSDSYCQTAVGLTGTGSSAVTAKQLWTEIQTNPDALLCQTTCCFIVT